MISTHKIIHLICATAIENGGPIENCLANERKLFRLLIRKTLQSRACGKLSRKAAWDGGGLGFRASHRLLVSNPEFQPAPGALAVCNRG
jgi:hypothetical protein